MRYRKLGSTGLEVSALGFGMLRPPRKPDGAIDREEYVRMLRYAIDHGVNYVDTAYTYQDGQSEVMAGEALADGYRKRVYLTTKSPVWLCKKEGDFDRFLEEQLRRLKTDYLDFYFLHGIERAYWEKNILPLGLIRKLEEAIRQGIVRRAGFSFHDSLPLFKEIIESTDIWALVQIQLNYYDQRYQAGVEGLRYAASRGLGVAIMEPLRGGFLAKLPPAPAGVFEASGYDMSPVEWALDYLWNMPEVSVVLSGVSSMEMLKQNLAYADESAPGMLERKQLEIIDEAWKAFKKYDVLLCTGCSYCSVCPQKIAIPKCFEVYNRWKMQGGEPKAYRKMYQDEVSNWGNLASDCVRCRKCEKVCPQHLHIPDLLEEVVTLFEK